MYRGKKVIAFIPAGRKRTLSILLPYLNKNLDLIDEIHLWMNTENQEDYSWLEAQENESVKLVKFDHTKFTWLNPIQLNTSKYYSIEPTDDENTIYIRFDDDIVFVEKNAVRNLLDFTIDNEQYFLVFPVIWNNAIISHIQQKLGNIGNLHGQVEEDCVDPIGWGNPLFGEYAHRILLDKIKNNTVSSLFFDRHELINAKRFSISCFAFRGKDFKEFNATMPIDDEEIFLTEMYPRVNSKLNAICGTSLVSHFTFFTQREHILTTDILHQYCSIRDWYLNYA